MRSTGNENRWIHPMNPLTGAGVRLPSGRLRQTITSFFLMGVTNL